MGLQSVKQQAVDAKYAHFSSAHATVAGLVDLQNAAGDIMDSDLPDTTRIEAFSDGVIAIIITIMVLDLRLPADALSNGFWDGLVVLLLPKMIVYVLSFFVVAIIWVRHHHLMHVAPRADRGLLWSNVHLLLWMSVIPVATSILSDNPTLPLAVAVYGFVLAGNAAAFLLVRWFIFDDTRHDADASQMHTEFLRRDIVVIALYVSSIPLAFASVYVSLAIFVLMPVVFFLPDLLGRERPIGSHEV
jgi:uncharacterized membrane protein